MREQSPKYRGGIDTVSTIDTLSTMPPILDDELIASVRRHDTFTSDASGEFTVHRASGKKQGIFKVWADSIIPRLEMPFDTPDAWAAKLRQQPLGLYQSLEQWRAYASQQDRRLQEIYARRPVPTDTVDKAVELFSRMFVAFGYAAPFYNLEALVVDNRDDTSTNPIEFREDDAGGALDVARTAEAINNISSTDAVEEFILENGATHDIDSNLITHEQARLLRKFARQAEAVTGACDIEFVIGEHGEVKVLQLRALDHVALSASAKRDLQPTHVVRIENPDELPELPEDAIACLHIGSDVDLEKFQGALFRWIISHESSVAEITLAHAIPPTCHFANIVNSLGIRVSTA